ncbi:hypothetical protein A2Y83_00720 [Candidatus Falkowbacteria bacterium RBG_13_39_14]|uniref:Uncharacterized protein n=1 Tax=Candidatus Falkowbacteria bacterium RBG_13_39_14 TaxID=1797985 RepID=A0A1F5S7H4_9BACT|nr:MAG: hypothetical protein A2Y83_00720 [Candidatus Falkowbacteria bacterium RBG_13_39_14]
MDKENLLKQINNFLDESPFEDEEIEFWKKQLPVLSEKDLEELLELLKEKLKIITDSNDVFIKIAEDALQERDKERLVIPLKRSIIDMPINELAGIFKDGLLKILTERDIISELNEYFFYSKANGEDALLEFDILIKALYENKEKIGDTGTGDWLKAYNGFNESYDRKSIDRINFATNYEKAKKMAEEERDILLKLLKLYDFLLNPDNMAQEISIGRVSKNISQADRQVKESDQEIIKMVLDKWRNNQKRRNGNKANVGDLVVSLVNGEFRESAEEEKAMVAAIDLSKTDPENLIRRGPRFALGGEGADGKFRVHAAGLNYIMGNYGIIDKNMDNKRVSSWTGIKLTESENMKIMRDAAKTMGAVQRAGYEQFLNKLENYGKLLRGGMGDFAGAVKKTSEAIDRSRSY